VQQVEAGAGAVPDQIDQIVVVGLDCLRGEEVAGVLEDQVLVGVTEGRVEAEELAGEHRTFGVLESGNGYAIGPVTDCFCVVGESVRRQSDRLVKAGAERGVL